MGNCQAAEVATVVIQHPGGKVERVYWSVSASRVMADNPGHYVAVIITAPASSSSSDDDCKTNNAGSKHNGRKRDPGGGGRAAVKHLKLLRPDDALLMGHVYRLVSFEEVVRKFETKRHAKLSKWVANSGNMEMSTCSTQDNDRRETGRERQGQGGDAKEAESEKNQDEPICNKSKEDEETDELVSVAQAMISKRRSMSASRPGQWRPALQSISEVP